jgi:hypothetical protein
MCVMTKEGVVQLDQLRRVIQTQKKGPEHKQEPKRKLRLGTIQERR